MPRGSVRKRRTHVPDTNVQYALEPIVPLGAARAAGSVTWWELLHRGGRRGPRGEPCLTPAEWREWYRVMPELVDSLMRRHTHVRLSINLSTYQLLDEQIRETAGVLARWGPRMALEWTEDPLTHAGLPGKQAAARLLTELRARWAVVIGIDDAGAGEDGVGRIMSLGEPPDFVKLDGKVLHAAEACPAVEGLLRGQIRAYREQQIDVVGEHVESVGQLRLAHRLCMNFAQGFLFTRGAAAVRQGMQDSAALNPSVPDTQA